jgi:deoxyribose-phosphate aldolase
MSSFCGSVSGYIDHTVLKQTTKSSDIEQLCKEAVTYSFAAVCVPPYWIKLAKSLTEGSSVKVATVIGFPFGYSTINSKYTEIEDAIQDKVDEVDIVASISAIKDGNWTYIEEEMTRLMSLIRSHNGLICKVIIESAMLTDEEIIECCKIYSKLNIDYLKTSTGFAEGGKGASIHSVKLFRQHLPAHIQIKASGGIRTLADTRTYIELGATRIGCSAGVKIMEEELAEKASSSGDEHEDKKRKIENSANDSGSAY